MTKSRLTQIIAAMKYLSSRHGYLSFKYGKYSVSLTDTRRFPRVIEFILIRHPLTGQSLITKD